MVKYKQGRYIVKNINKYRGNPNKVYYRSSWELKIFKKMDISPLVSYWSSEEIIIPYYDSIKKKKRKYYVDLYVEFSNKATYIFEIKPATKLIKPKITERNKYNEWTNIIEKANSAKKYCDVLKLKGVKVKFAFLSLINNKFQIIDF